MLGRFALAVVVLSIPAFALAADKDKEARKKAAAKRFEKLKDYCKERRVSHVVELLAEWGEFADANQQDDVTEMAAAIFKDAKAEASGLVAPRVGYRGTSATTKVKNLLEDASAYFVDEFVSAQPRWKPIDPFNGLGQHLVVASRTFVNRPNGEAGESVILTNAATAEVHGLKKCLVVASGNLVASREFDRSVVICRGDVQFEFGRRDSSLVKAGGKFLCTPDMVETLRGGGVPLPEPTEGLMTEKDTKFLGVKFYSTAEDGLEAVAEKEVVTVAKVDKAKAFGKAGVKEGDVLEEINGEKVPSLHELDRLVCRATVASGVAKLKVKRGEKSEEIAVKLADW